VALLHWRPPLLSVGPFGQEVTSLENRRIEFSQRPIIFYGSSSIRRWKTLSQDFVGYPVVNCGFGGSRLSSEIGRYQMMAERATILNRISH